MRRRRHHYEIGRVQPVGDANQQGVQIGSEHACYVYTDEEAARSRVAMVHDAVNTPDGERYVSVWSLRWPSDGPWRTLVMSEDADAIRLAESILSAGRGAQRVQVAPDVLEGLRKRRAQLIAASAGGEYRVSRSFEGGRRLTRDGELREQ